MSDAPLPGCLPPDPVLGGTVADPALSATIVTTEPVEIDLPGGQGIAGPPGEGSTTVRAFAGQAVWLIVHNLGRFPAVTTVETSGDQVVGDLRYLDADTLQVTFSVPVSGLAYLN